MTTIEWYREDGEGVRRLFLIAEVTFRDRPADNPQHRNYYQDAELAGVASGFMSDGLEDRDDNPSVRFHDVPRILLDDVRHVAKKERLERGSESEWRGSRDPALIAWGFIIEQNTCGGLDAGDLGVALERAGFPCPEGWGEE